jgi:hypothetical protein
MHRFLLPVLLCILTGCASNILGTDLLVSNTFFLPPSPANTVFIQNRNASDNQLVTLSDLESRLTAKGYRVVKDYQTAQFLVFTTIVYCNQTKQDLPVEIIVSGGYGSSIMSGLSSMTGMAGMIGGPIGMAASSAASGLLGSLGGGPSVGHKQSEGIAYACVVDLQITDRSKAGDEPAPVNPTPGSPPPPGVYQTRLGASVYQRKFDEKEATPLVQYRLSAAVAGYL